MGGSIIHERIHVKWLTFILAFTKINMYDDIGDISILQDRKLCICVGCIDNNNRIRLIADDSALGILG